MNSLTLAAIAFAMMLTIVAAAYGVYLYFNPSRTASDRLRDLSVSDTEDIGFEIGADAEGIEALAGQLGKLGGASSVEEASIMRRTLVQAGFNNRHALEMFNGVKVTLALTLPLLLLPIAASQSMSVGAMIMIGACAAGYYLPGVYITNLVNKRQHVLLSSFPDCLDLLVSSVEAGLGLDAAFRRVAAEMEASAPELSREFQLSNHEISAGVARVDALKHLYDRTGLDEVRSLVNMLSQAERFGTSVAKSLRVHAQVTRNKRMSKAEEEAAKVSPKLTVIMIVFLLPVLMSILIGPAMLNVMKTFSGGE